MNLKKYIFMFNKFRRDVSTPKQRYALADDMHSQELGLYYFVFQKKEFPRALIKRSSINLMKREYRSIKHISM